MGAGRGRIRRVQNAAQGEDLGVAQRIEAMAATRSNSEFTGQELSEFSGSPLKLMRKELEQLCTDELLSHTSHAYCPSCGSEIDNQRCPSCERKFVVTSEDGVIFLSAGYDRCEIIDRYTLCEEWEAQIWERSVDARRRATADVDVVIF